MLGIVKANLQLNILTIGINLSDIVLTYGNRKKFLLSVILILIQIINLINVIFDSIMNSQKNKT